MADPIPHVGGPIVAPGDPTVIVENQPAARVGDLAVCVPAIDAVAMGSPTVIIGNKPAARVGDPMLHGGIIVTGASSVVIGVPWQAPVLLAAARDGSPLMQMCEAMPMPAPPPVPPAQAQALQAAAQNGAPLVAAAAPAAQTVGK